MPVVSTSDGPIAYAQRGADGPAVVLIHGAGGTHTAWGNQLRDLSGPARVLALDLPGHGRSGTRGRSSVAEYSAGVLALLDALAIDRAVLVGHSMGAAICLQTALDAPDRVAGLGLVGAAARLKVAPAILAGFDNDVPATIRLIVSWSYAPDAPIELIVRAEADYAACDARVFKGDFVACSQFDVTSRLGAIRCPAAVVVGALDRMTPPRLADELAGQIPGAALTVVPEAGHTTMVERPQVVSAALLQLLERAS